MSKLYIIYVTPLLPDETKELMSKRDKTRKKLSCASQQEKKTLLIKYKKLRNQINQRIRIETRKFNNDRINAASDENEMWKVVNDVTIIKVSFSLRL